MQSVTRRLLLLATTTGALVTTVVIGVPTVPVLAEAPALRLVLDTVAALTALLLSLLVYGRLLLLHRTSDLALTAALGLAGVVYAGLLVLPQITGLGARSLAIFIWAAVAGELLVSACYATAAWVPARRSGVRHPLSVLVVGCLGPVALLAVTVSLLGPALPTATTPGQLVVRGSAEAAVTLVRALAAVLYVLAAAGFARRRNDPIAPALAAGAVLLAFGRLNYALVASVDPHWVYAGDVLRLLAYAVLLLAAVQEIRRYWADQATSVVQEERRRLAQTLHDGIAQEVSVLATQTRMLADGRPAMSLRLLASAAERALDESRAAIHALTGKLDEPLDLSLLRVADELEARLGVRVRTDLDRPLDLPRDVREAVVRAVREAVVNATRHGGADQVDVVLRAGEGVRLVVTDRGRGFDPGHESDGAGLQTARSRLEAVGGSLRVESAVGEGTRVEVQLS